jgi:uncharacterized protein YwgA
MLDSKRTALILALVDMLRKHDSWCGETHLQKAMFFLKDQRGGPADFEFVLYKHGPYSFDFHDTVSSLFAHCLLENESHPPYGPRIRLSESGNAFLVHHREELGDTQDKIGAIAEWFGSKGVMELEKFATAFWVRNESPDSPLETLAQEIHGIKPHIPENVALEALESIPQFAH